MNASAESDIISEFSGLSLSLPRVDDSRDNLPDSDHKAMDQAILKTFRSDILLNSDAVVQIRTGSNCEPDHGLDHIGPNHGLVQYGSGDGLVPVQYCAWI